MSWFRDEPRWLPGRLGLLLAGAATLVAIGSVLGCSAREGTPGEPTPASGVEADRPETVRLEGVLTGEGIECQALRTARDELYTLTGRIEGFTVGDRVRLEGRPARFSTCMQGVTVAVDRIERLE